MPSVRNDTTPADGGNETIARRTSAETATAGTVGNPAPKQQDVQVEHECA